MLHVTFCQINKSFWYIVFPSWKNVYAGQMWPAGRSLETPGLSDNSFTQNQIINLRGRLVNDEVVWVSDRIYSFIRTKQCCFTALNT